MSVWKHFASTNIWMVRDGVSFEWCFQHHISVSWTQGGTSKKLKSVWKPCCQLSDVLPNHLATCTSPRKKWQPENHSFVKKIGDSSEPSTWFFLDWCNYSTTSFERFHIQLRSLVVARLIWFALERLATRRVCILWEYSSATIVDDDAELVSKWTD